MNSVIFNPLEEYKTRLSALHKKNTAEFFERLVRQSGINIEENRKTVNEYYLYKENTKKLRRKLNLLRVLRVILCITVILIPIVIWKLTPKIKKLREEVENADSKTAELLALANSQMAPLNSLFTSRDSIKLTEETVPLLSFDDRLSVRQEIDMKINFDFKEFKEEEQSSLDLLAGQYNENPFIFENKLVHRMGTETYHGYKTISWTESYRDSDGRLRTRTRTETLHATVTKPKPFYRTQAVLYYGAQAAPELSFSRDAGHLEKLSEKEIERHIKKGEKRLKKLTDKAIRDNRDFVSMSNSDFEVLFDALNRTDEVGYRTLFTPLAQTNMVELIRSKETFGDDFEFLKLKRMNKITSNHSQDRPLTVDPKSYISFSYDIIKESFEGRNAEYFKAVYFDFAPLLAIPAYQERPVHSLKPIPDYSERFSERECEALANMVDRRLVVHPNTKTEAILKTDYVSSRDEADERRIKAYSYDIFPRVDYVTVHGGDGRFHSVAVNWDEYIPLEAENSFFVSYAEKGQNPLASRNGICIYN